MYRARLIVIPLLSLLLGSSAAAAQRPGSAHWADSARTEIRAARLARDVDRLARARALLERAVTIHGEDGLLLHYLGYAAYREASLRGDGESEARDSLLMAARRHLEASLEFRPLPETHALLALIMGRQIGDDPSLGRSLGPQIANHMSRASSLGPDNPRASLLQGINALYTPPGFGGGREAAKRHLSRAIEQFEADGPAPPLPSWGHAEAYAWLGIAYGRDDQFDRARRAFERALELEPGYTWVRSTLIPLLERRMEEARGRSGRGEPDVRSPSARAASDAGAPPADGR